MRDYGFEKYPQDPDLQVWYANQRASHLGATSSVVGGNNAGGQLRHSTFAGMTGETTWNARESMKPCPSVVGSASARPSDMMFGRASDMMMFGTGSASGAVGGTPYRGPSDMILRPPSDMGGVLLGGSSGILPAATQAMNFAIQGAGAAPTRESVAHGSATQHGGFMGRDDGRGGTTMGGVPGGMMDPGSINMSMMERGTIMPPNGTVMPPNSIMSNGMLPNSIMPNGMLPNSIMPNSIMPNSIMPPNSAANGMLPMPPTTMGGSSHASVMHGYTPSIQGQGYGCFAYGSASTSQSSNAHQPVLDHSGGLQIGRVASGPYSTLRSGHTAHNDGGAVTTPRGSPRGSAPPDQQRAFQMAAHQQQAALQQQQHLAAAAALQQQQHLATTLPPFGSVRFHPAGSSFVCSQPDGIGGNRTEAERTTNYATNVPVPSGSSPPRLDFNAPSGSSPPSDESAGGFKMADCAGDPANSVSAGSKILGPSTTAPGGLLPAGMPGTTSAAAQQQLPAGGFPTTPPVGGEVTLLPTPQTSLKCKLSDVEMQDPGRGDAGVGTKKEKPVLQPTELQKSCQRGFHCLKNFFPLKTIGQVREYFSENIWKKKCGNILDLSARSINRIHS